MISLSPKDISTAKLHSYLLSAVAPRPIAFASTINDIGDPNLSPFSFFNVFSANPPILIFSPARRVKNNTTKHTLENVLVTKEVVINVVNYDLVHQASLSSTEYKAGVNEFDKSGLTMLKSDLVKPFRVKESPVQFECVVNDVIALGKEGGAGNLVICEVVRLHIAENVLDSDKNINQEQLDLVARSGGAYYTRAKQGFFEIPKPLRTLGIGVDALPNEVRNSTVLTGNDLGMLGNVEALPSKEEANAFVNSLNGDYPNIKSATTIEKHQLAHDLLSSGKVNDALKLVLT